MTCELPGLIQALILVYLHVNPFCAVKLRETSLLVHQKQLNYQLQIKILAYQAAFVEEKHIFRNKHLFTFWPVEVVSLRRTDQTNIVKGNDFFKQSHTFASYFWWHFIVPAKAKLPELLHENFCLDEDSCTSTNWIKDSCHFVKNLTFWEWRVIIAVNFQFKQLERRSLF